MKLQPYVEKLSASKEYKTFQSKYKDAFIIAGFFVLDLEFGKHIHQIDYYIPSQKKVAAFTLDDKVSVQILETMTSKKPEKLDIKTKIDLDALQGILEDEMKNRNITDSIRKIIAVVQNIDGKKIWNLNCVLTGMEILRAHVEDESKTVLKMERSSIMDYIRKVPVQEMLQEKNKSKKGSAKNEEDKIKKLEELQKALEKEKQRYQKAAEEAPEEE